MNKVDPYQEFINKNSKYFYSYMIFNPDGTYSMNRKFVDEYFSMYHESIKLSAMDILLQDDGDILFAANWGLDIIQIIRDRILNVLKPINLEDAKNPNGIYNLNSSLYEYIESAILGFDAYGVQSGFRERNDDVEWNRIINWFQEKHELYIHISPEFYHDCINFCWQILWYLPKEKWTKDNCSDGTGLYGDNGEYPTMLSAKLGCIRKMIEIVKNK